MGFFDMLLPMETVCMMHPVKVLAPKHWQCLMQHLAGILQAEGGPATFTASCSGGKLVQNIHTFSLISQCWLNGQVKFSLSLRMRCRVRTLYVSVALALSIQSAVSIRPGLNSNAEEFTLRAMICKSRNIGIEDAYQ